MSESLLEPDLTEDEAKAIQAEIDAKSEDDPGSVPIERRQKSPSERFGLTEAPEEDGTDASSDESKAEDKEVAEEPPSQWELEKKGILKELSRVRDARRRDQEEATRREKMMLEEFQKAIRTSKESPPDREIEPERYAEYVEQQNQELRKEQESVAEEHKAQEALQARLRWVTDQEADYREDHADYDAAIQWAIKDEITKRVKANPGMPEEYLRDALLQGLGELQNRYYEAGGNWAEWAYAQALERGWGKQGENKADAPAASNGNNSRPAGDAVRIAAGQKAAKTSSKGSGASTSDGVLTPEEIFAIKDPERHEAEYKKWLAKMTGTGASEPLL